MPALIEIDRLRKKYHLGGSDVKALRGVSMSIPQGDFVAVIGPSGSGKSTFMNLLGCLDTPSAGSYRFDGSDTAGMDADQLATMRNRNIGFVFQSFNLLPRATALANVALPMVYAGVGTAERGQRARTALERVGLGNRMHHRPTQLSGGQQQRVAIARAIVNQPKLVLADEPTGALDTRTSLDIMALFQRLNREGITMVVVTHEPDVARFANRRLTFRDGRIVDDRTQAPADAGTLLAEAGPDEEVAA